MSLREASLGRLLTGRLQLCDILEKAKLWRQWESMLQVVSGGGGRGGA